MWLKLKEILSDKAYLIALLLPFPTWIYFSDLKGINYLSVNEILMLLILFPVTEELFFRGIIQPIIYKKFSKTWRSISVANVLTSLLFSVTHLFNHNPIWALSTFFPSLVFGWSKDRYNTLLAPLMLHCYYNAGWFYLAY
ncbi:MAG: JDVT-CTERM system glutamic-type intramembrane protease [Pseudomonadota bacterium]|nr:JDVT-CTERM system glutamic-type intramembrane protease [Pseudomonadota bacterium]